MFSIRKPTSIVLLTLTTLVTSCGGGDIDSKDLKSSDIRAVIEIYGEENKTLVEVTLMRNFSFVELSSGDNFTVNAFGENKALTRTYGGFNTQDNYSATFNNYSAEELVTLNLSRASESDAPNSSIHLPEPVSIYSHTEKTTVSADESVTLLWDTSAESEINLVANVFCEDSNGGSTLPYGYLSDKSSEDTGSYTLTFKQILAQDKQNSIISGTQCEGRVNITRTTYGEIDSAFSQGSSIKAQRTSTADFVILF